MPVRGLVAVVVLAACLAAAVVAAVLGGAGPALLALLAGSSAASVALVAATTRRRAAQASQSAYLDLLLAASGERDILELLVRHVGLALPGTVVTLTRPVERETCLAARLGRSYSPDGEPAVSTCATCAAANRRLCVPLLPDRSSDGALGVGAPRRLTPLQRELVEESVSLASRFVTSGRILSAAERRAAVDPLTGLAGPEATHATLRLMAAQAGRAVAPLAAVLVDLDRFAEVNATYGRDAGDDVVARVGVLLGSVLRQSDFAGRLGGEEFLVLLPDTDAHQAGVLARQLLDAICGVELPDLDRVLTASIGVAALPDDGRDADALLNATFRALAGAKAAGRNCVQLAAAEPGPR